MDDVLLVSRFQRVFHLAGNRERFGRRQWTVADPIRERVTLDVFEDDDANGGGVFKAVNRGDVRVVERREQSRFAFETGQAIGIGRPLGRQHLEGHVAPEPGVACAVDLAHAAGARKGPHVVMTKALSDDVVVHAPGAIRHGQRMLGLRQERFDSLRSDSSSPHWLSRNARARQPAAPRRVIRSSSRRQRGPSADEMGSL